MPTSDQSDTQVLENVLEQWALAWSSGDAETLLPLFVDSVVYEDVTLGAVNHGKNPGPYAGHDQRLLAGVARWFNKKRVIPCVYFYLAWNENGMRSSLMNFWHQRSVWPIRNRPSSEVISMRSGTGNSLSRFNLVGPPESKLLSGQ